MKRGKKNKAIEIAEKTYLHQEDGSTVILEAGDRIQVQEEDSPYAKVFQSSDGNDFFDEIIDLVKGMEDEEVEESGRALGAWINSLLDDLGDASGEFEAALKNSMR